jgi:hypothetical protein
MISFHGAQEIKDKFINQLEGHYVADEIIKGIYWGDGKGCAIGCTIHGNDHKKYESDLGIPEWLARLEDRLFEGLPNAHAKEFPLLFLRSIPVGVDLDKIKSSFLIVVLEKALESFNHDKFPEVKKSILNVIGMLRGERLAEAADYAKAAADAEAAAAAVFNCYSVAAAADSADSAVAAAYASAADSAADSADSAVAAVAAAYAAAAAAADSADSSDSAVAAAYAAAAAAASAADSADSAVAAAYAAAATDYTAWGGYDWGASAWAAASAAYAADSAWSARYETYIYFKDKLIELLKREGGTE